jgi:hypothetical protein
MPAVDAAADALEALRELSALNWLSSQRRTGSAVQDAADDAARRLDAAVARLEDLPADSVTAALRDEVAVIADRVHAELHDDTADPTFAQDMARGAQASAPTPSPAQPCCSTWPPSTTSTRQERPASSSS